MRRTAREVTLYLDEVPAERKAALAKLRDLCCTSLKGFEESMLYGGPCYSRNGQVEVGFANGQLTGPKLNKAVAARPLKRSVRHRRGRLFKWEQMQ